MVMRRCPVCGQKWYSAAQEDNWVCDVCGAELDKELNEPPTETREPHSKQV